MSIENESPDAVLQRVAAARRNQSKTLAAVFAAPFRWLGFGRRERVSRHALHQLSPALLADVGLRRIGDTVIGAETPDCANNNCADVFIGQRAA